MDSPQALIGFRSMAGTTWVYENVAMKVGRRLVQAKPRETEAALVIHSNKAEAIAKEIASLHALGKYRLERQETQEIRDVYFDTPDGELQEQQLALRIRQVGGKFLITLKGASALSDWGGRERIEIEMPWSRQALTQILEALRDRDIEVAELYKGFSRAKPVETMTRLGFRVVQDRKTRRQVRDVVRDDESRDTVLAEMAIDSVTYRFGRQVVRLHEIEIESKAKGKTASLADVVNTLVGKYKPTLRMWESKLATGRAIQELLEDGALDKLVDQNNNLKPAAYDVIERYVR